MHGVPAGEQALLRMRSPALHAGAECVGITGGRRGSLRGQRVAALGACRRAGSASVVCLFVAVCPDGFLSGCQSVRSSGLSV